MTSDDQIDGTNFDTVWMVKNIKSGAIVPRSIVSQYVVPTVSLVTKSGEKEFSTELSIGPCDGKDIRTMLNEPFTTTFELYAHNMYCIEEPEAVFWSGDWAEPRWPTLLKGQYGQTDGTYL